MILRDDAFKKIMDAVEYLHSLPQGINTANEITRLIQEDTEFWQQTFPKWAGSSFEEWLINTQADRLKRKLNATAPTLFDSFQQVDSKYFNFETIIHTDKIEEDYEILYQYTDSPFGAILIASDPLGICYTAFDSDLKNAVENLQKRFPNRSFQSQSDNFQELAQAIFLRKNKEAITLPLHLTGTDFQIKVWKALSEIPFGTLQTYKNMAEKIGQPTASRAVGTAIGNNPIAYFIPCHRVIQTSGHSGGYMWGSNRKKAILAFECAQTI